MRRGKNGVDASTQLYDEEVETLQMLREYIIVEEEVCDVEANGAR